MKKLARDEHESKRPHILMSAPSLDPTVNVSGVSSVAAGLIRALDGRVHYTHILIGAPTTANISQKFESAFSIVRAIAKIAQSRSEMFHSNTALNTKSIIRDTILISAARIFGKHIVLHLHGGRYLSERAPPIIEFLIYRLLRASDVVIALSARETEILRRRFPSAPTCKQVYNFVDQNRFISSRARGDEPTVLFVGRLVEEKGILDVMACARTLSRQGVRFTIYGSGPLQHLVEAEHRAGNLTYCGVFSPEDAADIYGCHQILLLPSTSGEGMPMAIVEGMSAGVIPLATESGSVSEIVKSGETGVIVRPNDPEGMAQVIRRLLADPLERYHLSTRAQEFARSVFSADEAAKKMLAIYNDLLDGKSA